MTGELRNLLREARDRRVRELLDYQRVERRERELSLVIGRADVCSRGHELVGDNVIFSDGRMKCRACKRASDRERYWRMKGQA